jgi:hypothetical protein
VRDQPETGRSGLENRATERGAPGQDIETRGQVDVEKIEDGRGGPRPFSARGRRPKRDASSLAGTVKPAAATCANVIGTGAGVDEGGGIREGTSATKNESAGTIIESTKKAFGHVVGGGRRRHLILGFGLSTFLFLFPFFFFFSVLVPWFSVLIIKRGSGRHVGREMLSLGEKIPLSSF